MTKRWVGCTVRTVFKRYAEAIVQTDLKSQIRQQLALLETLALMTRANEAKRVHGVEAAWKVIFEGVCTVGQDVREVSPAALMTYRSHINLAKAFLEENPDKYKVQALGRRVVDDLAWHSERFTKMGPDCFALEDYPIIAKSMKSVRESIESLMLAH